ncbi:hypothetical protein OSTOST_04409, partial [Ostertagia ostertagi]
IYQALLWLNHREPCDIFPKRSFDSFYGIIILYFLFYMLILQPVMSFERAVATIYVNSYESWNKTSGIIYVFVSGVIPSGMVLYVCAGASFNEPNLSCSTVKTAVRGRVAAISLLAIIVSLISVVVQQILAIINKKRCLRLVTIGMLES